MEFNGSFDELQSLLSPISHCGKWADIGNSRYEFSHENGEVIQWDSDTGRFFSNEEETHNLLTLEFKKLLEGNGDVQASQTIIQDETPIQSPNDYQQHYDSEVVIGLVGAVGTDLDSVSKIIKERLKSYKYNSNIIKISKDIIENLFPSDFGDDNYNRIDSLMTNGNKLRESTKDNSILALSAAAKINQIRNQKLKTNGPLKKQSFIISSLKHPEEVHKLREIYSNGFFLIGVFASEERRLEFLTQNKDIEISKAQYLISRDSDESSDSGQHTRDTYHLSDFFIHYDGNYDKLHNDIWRALDLAFGKPFVTPTFDEYAMFMAFSASLRSADLSRQVGAIVSKNNNIVSTGANDIPQFGGGLYWPDYDEKKVKIVDKKNGRDYLIGKDSNAIEKNSIVDDILSNLPELGISEPNLQELKKYLKKSRIKDITEYGRVVHAEMEAILACARNNISTQGAQLYCTTFPCHNCAKHIVASGINRVVYVEPYPKSKAFEFHSDSVSQDTSKKGYVHFVPFVGVGPRSFFNLFSTNLGSGYSIRRKGSDGKATSWHSKDARLRMQMLPTSYIEREMNAAAQVQSKLEQTNV